MCSHDETSKCEECKGSGDGRIAKPDRSRIPGEAKFPHHVCKGTGRLPAGK